MRASYFLTAVPYSATTDVATGEQRKKTKYQNVRSATVVCSTTYCCTISYRRTRTAVCSAGYMLCSWQYYCLFYYHSTTKKQTKFACKSRFVRHKSGKRPEPVVVHHQALSLWGPHTNTAMLVSYEVQPCTRTMPPKTYMFCIEFAEDEREKPGPGAYEVTNENRSPRWTVYPAGKLSIQF